MISRDNSALASHPGLSLLQAATHWYDAKDITSATQQTLPNGGTGGGSLTLGSSGSAEASDPRRFPHSTNYISFPGTSLDYLADTVTLGLSQSSLFTWRFDAEMADWSPASPARIISINPGTTIQLNATSMDFYWYGVAGIAFASTTVAAPFSDGSRGQLRFDVDTTGQTVSVYHRTSGDLTVDTGWTLLQTITSTPADPRRAQSGAEAAALGGWFGASFLWEGNLHGLYCYDSQNDIVDFEFNPSDIITAGASTLTLTSGLEFSVGSNDVRLVMRPFFKLDGSDDLVSGQTFTTPYVVKRSGSSLVIAQQDPTTVIAAADVYAIVDRGSAYSAGEQADILGYMGAV